MNYDLKVHFIPRTFASNNTVQMKSVMGQGMGRRVFLLITIHVTNFRIISKSYILRLSYLTFLDFHKAVVFQCAYLISDFCILYNDLTFCTE